MNNITNGQKFMMWIKSKYGGWENISESVMDKLNDAFDAGIVSQVQSESEVKVQSCNKCAYHKNSSNQPPCFFCETLDLKKSKFVKAME